MPEDLYDRERGYATYIANRALPAAPSATAPAAAYHQVQAAGYAPGVFSHLPGGSGASSSPASSGGYAATSPGAGASAGAIGSVQAGGYPDFANMSDADIDKYVLDNYPSYSWMLNNPEIGPILRDGARNGWSSAELTSKIQATDWFKQTSATNRAWNELWQTDPATATAQRNDKKTDLMAMASDAGIPLNDAQATWIANAAIANGMTDLEIRQNIMSFARSQASQGSAPPPATGTIGNTAVQIKQIAAQYLMGVSNDQALKYAQDIWTGAKTAESVQGDFAAMASASWAARDPGMADAISRGMTPRSYIDPQLQMVASTLQMSPDQINVLDPKWSGLINYDSGDGNKRIATVPEAEQFARGQYEYRFTDQANDEADKRVATILGSMGERKF